MVGLQAPRERLLQRKGYKFPFSACSVFTAFSELRFGLFRGAVSVRFARPLSGIRLQTTKPPAVRNANAAPPPKSFDGASLSQFDFHSRSVLRRNALPITLTELKAMAAAAMMGLSVQPKNG
ncbi:hypothetical protein SAE02_69340 [Skermanella aerolata]|uniref:Uncharacterized protein n=1 Tax=Skermanella aerolata TaxID=393310 RepID=A0A512E277_9PROT|nr:hypothetical protein SAE02_69340 [Skermanella aerolata]